jgi:hypothetical protein
MAQLAQHLFSGHARGREPLFQENDSLLQWHDYDPEKAHNCCEKAGYGVSVERRPFTLYFIQSPRTYLPDPLLMQNMIRHDLEQVGIPVEIKPMEYMEYKRMLKAGCMTWPSTGVAEIADPTNICTDCCTAPMFCGKPAPTMRSSKTQYDVFVDRARQEQNPRQRAGLYRQALWHFPRRGALGSAAHSRLVITAIAASRTSASRPARSCATTSCGCGAMSLKIRHKLAMWMLMVGVFPHLWRRGAEFHRGGPLQEHPSGRIRTKSPRGHQPCHEPCQRGQEGLDFLVQEVIHRGDARAQKHFRQEQDILRSDFAHLGNGMIHVVDPREKLVGSILLGGTANPSAQKNQEQKQRGAFGACSPQWGNTLSNNASTLDNVVWKGRFTANGNRFFFLCRGERPFSTSISIYWVLSWSRWRSMISSQKHRDQPRDRR